MRAERSFRRRPCVSHRTRGTSICFDLALQRDGKIVVAGSASDPTTFKPRFALARYRTDGARDPTFSGDGRVITGFPGDFAEAFGVALQQNGKIVAAGDTRPGSFDFQFALARYRPDGTLDPTFSGDGKATTAFAAGESAGASDLGIQADGKIVAAGTVLHVQRGREGDHDVPGGFLGGVVGRHPGRREDRGCGLLRAEVRAGPVRGFIPEVSGDGPGRGPADPGHGTRSAATRDARRPARPRRPPPRHRPAAGQG